MLLVCVYKCQFGKYSFFFLPRFKYFLYLDPLVTSEPGAFQRLFKKYLLFLGGVYFEELENSLYLLCNVKSKPGAGFNILNRSVWRCLGCCKVVSRRV